MNSYIDQINSVIDAIKIQSPVKFTWFGKVSPPFLKLVSHELPGDVIRSQMIFLIQNELYVHFYCHGIAIDPEGLLTGSDLTVGSAAFTEELSRANKGLGYWEKGWKLISKDDEEAVIGNGYLMLTAPLRECKFSSSKIRKGTGLSLKMPKELLQRSPGFYMVLGDVQLSEQESKALIRLYWNVTPKGAIDLIHNVSKCLNRAEIPFKLKVLSRPELYNRSDAAVLYCYKRDYERIIELIESFYLLIKYNLKESIPAFTKLLLPGLALAENPSEDQSFGQHRCGLLAKALYQSFEGRVNRKYETLSIIRQGFNEMGILLEAPYLNAGSSDRYRQLNFGEPHFLYRDNPKSEFRIGGKPGGNLWIETASQIANNIIKEAIWHKECCNWLNVKRDEDKHGRLRSLDGATLKSLLPDFYEGTAGISVFLAELWNITGDCNVKKAAKGALFHAVENYENQLKNALGLYTGWIGVGLAAARVGSLLKDEWLLLKAGEIFSRIIKKGTKSKEFDMLGGKAGAICGFLAAKDLLQNQQYLDYASLLGEELVSTCEQSEKGISWKHHGLGFPKNLLGFSHGTSGIAYALLQLWDRSNNNSFLNTGREAMRYEEGYFNEAKQNWPDFRQKKTGSRDSNRNYTYETFWCHGAPGIALARLKAYELLQEDTIKQQLLIALDTTEKAIQKSLSSGNYSLCHGLSGNADIIIEANNRIADYESGLDIANEVALQGICKYGKTEKNWPCGGIHSTPGLMLGRSGIGYYYLRMFDGSIPSVLRV